MKKDTIRLLLVIFSAVLLFFICDNALYITLRYGLDKHYGLNEKASILAIGNSHILYSLDESLLEDSLCKSVALFSRIGINTPDKLMMSRYYLNHPCSDSLRCVIYELNFYSFKDDGNSQNSYKLAYPFMGDSVVDSYLRQYDSFCDHWLHRFVRSYRFQSHDVYHDAFIGLFNFDSYNRKDVFSPSEYARFLADNPPVNTQRPLNPKLINVFDETINEFTSRGIDVILLQTPLAKPYEATLQPQFDTVTDLFHDYASRHPHVYFLRVNPDYSNDSSLFFDRHHLNQKGRHLLSTDLIHYLRHYQLPTHK